MSLTAMGQKTKNISLSIDLSKAKIGKILSDIYLSGDASHEELQFLASCVSGFRKSISNSYEQDFSTSSYKEFWLGDAYDLNPSDDDITIDVETPMQALDRNDSARYKSELKKCIHGLLMTATVETYRR
jgi:hypothetical protein